MKTKITKARRIILNGRFEEDRAAIKSVFIFNLLFAALYCFCWRSDLFITSRLLICLITGLAFLVISYIYDWRSVVGNLYLVLLYIILLFTEYFWLGVPTGVGLVFSNQVSKGVLLEILIAMIPYLYIGIKIFLIIPLIKICFSSWGVSTIA